MRNKFIHYPLVMALMLLFCVPCVTVTYAQSFTVTGTVTDSQGGIPGANVKVKGGTAGTITNMDGQFTLSVPSSKSILVVSYIGYTPQEVAINGKNKLDIHLLEDTKTLDEVVVVGYGVQKKSHLTGSVSKMDINNLTDIPVTQVDQLLQGKIAGVNIQNSTSEAGAAPQIRVRGMGSISADSSPLIVIDGYPTPDGLSTLDMADISSIEVLKDAASAAVYGSRAANGVVLVTTKQGAIGKVKVSYDFSYGWQSAWKKRSMLNASEYATLMNEAQQYSNGTDRFSNTNLGVGTDWQDVLFNDGAPVQNHQLSISGANEKVSYYFSAGYYNQEGIIGGNYDRSNYERLSFRSNTLYTLFDETKNRS